MTVLLQSTVSSTIFVVIYLFVILFVKNDYIQQEPLLIWYVHRDFKHYTWNLLPCILRENALKMQGMALTL